jgi:hypothetical protein
MVLTLGRKPVFLKAAVGFVGEGVFDEVSIDQLFDGALEGTGFTFEFQSVSQFVRRERPTLQQLENLI